MAYNKLQKLSDNIEAIRIAFDVERGHVPTESEKAALSKYSGFGGLKFVLIPEGPKENWKKQDQSYYEKTQELWGLLRSHSADDAEYRRYVSSIRNSVLTSFYTPVPVVDAIASSMKKAGLQVSTMLEPSSGSGVFIYVFQRHFPDLHVTAFEKDLVTGKVLSARHQEADVHVEGFETIDSSLRGSFDLVVSNIPFGDVKVFDPMFSNSPLEAHRIAAGSIHNYFFLKALSEVRDGGVVAFITSRGVLDSERGRSVREVMVQQADLVSVHRLPDGMFRDEAGTDVGSDLVVLQRHDGKQQLTDLDRSFIDLVPVEVAPEIRRNGLFAHAFRIIDTEQVVSTDPYGKPAMVHRYDKGIDKLAEEIGSWLDIDLKDSLDKELYGKIDHSKDPKPRPQVAQPVQLTLFDFWDEEGNIVTEDPEDMKPHPFAGELFPHFRDGIIVFDGNQFGYLSNCGSHPVFTPMPVKDEDKERLKQYLKIRDAYERLYLKEAEEKKEAEELRKELNEAYDRFFHLFGYLNARKNQLLFKLDVLGRDTLTLENAAADGKTFVKADIFLRPVSFSLEEDKPVTTSVDALSASLNRTGGVDLDYMSEISGIDVVTLKEELNEKIFYNPFANDRFDQQSYEVADKFLSGNVVEKLDRFEGFASSDETVQQEIERSRAALEAVRPTPIPFEELDFNFGERWMPKTYFEEFASKLFDTDVHIDFAPQLDEYVVTHSGYSHKANEEYAVTGETKTYDGYDLLRHALYNTVPTIQKVIGYTPEGKSIMGPDHEKIQLAASKIDQIRDEFTVWVEDHPKEWKDDLADMYNRRFNCFVRAKYDGSHQTFPGLDLKGLAESKYRISDVYQSQKDCVWMLLQNGGGICDHEVGTGKTLIMCMAAHEMKRLGLAHKPVILGMKANVSEIAATYQTAYPDDRILYASAKDFKDRENFLNRMKNNDYDCVIMSHDQFSMIPQSPEIQRLVMEEELFALDEALEVYHRQGHSISGKMLTGLEKRKENLTAEINKINHALASRADDVVDFGNLGVDHLFVDESQVFKNLAFSTRDSRVAGLGDPKGSQRARNLQYAIRTIQERTGRDLGATFLSGTTISNSLTELYLLFKYLRPRALDRQEIHSFDAWAAVFARKSRDYEINVAGSIVMKERFRHFIKVPELAAFYNEITDYRTAGDVGLDRPNMSVRLVNLEPTESHKDFSERLLQFAQNGDGSLVFRNDLSDNEQKAKMLLVTNMGKKASLSPKLVNMDYEEGDNTKLGAAARNIAEYYRKFDEHKGTQFVFCDLSTPKKGEWSAYQELKDRLVSQYGIPEAEIGFIQDATTENKKKEYIAMMNRGEIRVMLGSTTMLGTGVNAQERAVAVHHLDLPWRPSDMEQRNGRAMRKGNDVARLYAGNNVDCFVYAVERSLDSYNFYLLQAKSEFIRQMKTSSLAKRSFDQGGVDEDNGMPFAEYVAITSGNNDLLERAKLEKRILGLESERKAFLNEQRHVADLLAFRRSDLERSERILATLRADFDRLEKGAVKDENGKYVNALQLHGLPGLHKEEEKGSFLQEQARRLITEETEIGHLFGFPLIMRPKDPVYEGKRIGNQFFVKGSYTYTYSDGFLNMASRVAAASYALTAISKLPSLIERYEKDVQTFSKDIPELERISGKQWEKSDMLKDLKDQMAGLDRKIQQDIDVRTMEMASAKEDLPFTIEEKSWGRFPWELTFMSKDYPFVTYRDRNDIETKYHGSFRTLPQGKIEGSFKHQYGAQEAIKEITKLNAERMKDLDWLKKAAADPDDTEICVAAIRQLRSQGLDRFGRSMLLRSEERKLNVIALAPYEDVRMLAHAVKRGHDVGLETAATAMSKVISSLPDKDDAILVPMPGHRGFAHEMARLTDLIEVMTDVPSVKVLLGSAHEELYFWKKDHPDEPLPELFFIQNERLRGAFEGKTPILIDNVLDTGHTAWAALEALEKQPVLITLGATGNHIREGHAIDVQIDEHGKEYIEEARPEGVGFTGWTQETFDRLLAQASDMSGHTHSNMHEARRILRTAGYDWHSGRPLFEVGNIADKWDVAYEEELRPAMQQVKELRSAGHLFTDEELRVLPEEKVRSLEERMDRAFAVPGGVMFIDTMLPIRNFFIEYELMKQDAAKSLAEERQPDVRHHDVLHEKISTIGQDDAAKAIDLIYRRGSEEVRSIIDKARQEDSLLKAPNGETTTLTPAQWVFVRTQDFKDFFEGSVALDAKQEPLSLYHGTLYHDFETFRNEGNGIYFTPQKEAAQTYGANDMQPYKVFVRLTNPSVIDFDGDSDTEDNDVHATLEEEYHAAVKGGYDGVIATNTFDGENELDQYVIHRSEDIMLADDHHLLHAMGIHATEQEQKDGFIRMMKSVRNDEQRYRIVQNDYYQDGIPVPDDYSVDFGMKHNLLQFVTLKEIQDIAADHGGTADNLRLQANRIKGNGFWNAVEAREFADEVLQLVDDRTRQYEVSLRDSLVSLMRNAGIHVVVDKDQAQQVFDAAVKDENGNLKPYSERKDVNKTDIRFFKTHEGGEAYGFVHKGTIYLDGDIATSETPIHEYTHLWAEALRQRNPEEWNNVVSLMKEAKDVWSKVQREYPELNTDDAIADEVLAQYSGRRGHDRLLNDLAGSQAPDTLFEKISQALEKVWIFVADFLHIHYESKEQVADQVLRDMLHGVNPLQYRTDVVSRNIKDYLEDDDFYHLPKNLDKAYTRFDSLVDQYFSSQSVEDRRAVEEEIKSFSPTLYRDLNAYFGVGNFRDKEQLRERYEELVKDYVVNKDVIYTGLFVEDKASLTKTFTPVHPNVFADHITTSFRPESINTLELGKDLSLHIKARLTTDKVDVLLFQEDFEDLKSLGVFDNINGTRGVKGNEDIPHITLSTADGVPPSESNKVIKEFLELDEELSLLNSSGPASEMSLSTFDKFMHGIGFDTDKMKTAISDRQSYDLDVDSIKEKLSGFSYTPLDATVNVRSGAFMKDGNVIFSPVADSSLKLQKVGATTVNKVSWEGSLDVYSSSNYLPVRTLSQGVKQGNEESMQEASVILSRLVERVPGYKDAVLVPVPNRNGHAGYTLDLANSIARDLNLEVADVLVGKPHKALYSRKEDRGNDGLRLMRFDTKADIPQGKHFILIDNVLDTGTTAMSAMRTLGDNTSLVVLGNTVNSHKYNYPIEIQTAPVVTDRLTKSRVTAISSALQDYYKPKLEEAHPGMDVKDVIKLSDLKSWPDVVATVQKVEALLPEGLSDVDKAISHVMIAESAARLTKDIRKGINPDLLEDGWKVNVRTLDGQELSVLVPKDKAESVRFLRDEATVALNEADFNHVVAQLVPSANATLSGPYLAQSGKASETGRLQDVVSVNTVDGRSMQLYAYNIEALPFFSDAMLSFGEHLSDVLSKDVIMLDDIAVEDRAKVTDAVLLATGLDKEKTLYEDNYLVDSAALIRSQRSELTADEKQMLSMVVSDFETGNHLLGRPRPDGYRAFMREVAVANDKATAGERLTVREVSLLKEEGTMYSRGLDELALRLGLKEAVLAERLGLQVQNNNINDNSMEKYSLEEILVNKLLSEAQSIKSVAQGISIKNSVTGAEWRVFGLANSERFSLWSHENGKESGVAEGLIGNGWSESAVRDTLSEVLKRWGDQYGKYEVVDANKDERLAAGIALNDPIVEHKNDTTMTEEGKNAPVSQEGEQEQKPAQAVESSQEQAPAQQTANKPRPNRWANYDYSKNKFPEGVVLEKANVFKAERGDHAGRYCISATINGERKTAPLYTNDVAAYFERGEDDKMTRRVSAEVLAAKYFAKDYTQQQAPAQQQSAPKEETRDDLVSQGKFNIPTYAIPYFAKGTDGLDGLTEEDVDNIYKFEEGLQKPYHMNFPDDIDAVKKISDSPAFGQGGVDVVEIEIFQVKEKVQEEQQQTVDTPKDYSRVQLLKDDDGKYVIYAVPEGRPAFTAYPTKEDVNSFFESFREKNDNVRKELAAKYYAVVSEDPSKQSNIFSFGVSADDVAKIERANIFRNKENSLLCLATIGGEQQKPIEISQDQWQRLWLAPDQKEYKTQLAAKLYEDVLHPELKEAAAAKEKEKEEVMETEQEETVVESKTVNKPSAHAELILSALGKAQSNDGILLNADQKNAPELTQKGKIISPFTSLMMSAHSDQHGYKTNVYTSFGAAKDEGYMIRKGQESLQVNWYKWDNYVHRYDEKSVINKATFEQLPAEEKELYRPALDKQVNRMFNIDQTIMKQSKPEVYQAYTAAVEKNVSSTQVSEEDLKKDNVYSSYMSLKEKHPDAIILCRVGDFYEVYGKDAETAAEKLSLTAQKSLSAKDAEGKAVSMLTIPHTQLDTALPTLIRAGERVAISDQNTPVNHVQSAAVENAYKKLDQLKASLQQLGEEVRITDTEESKFENGVLYINDSRWTDHGKEFEQAAIRLNDAYRSVVAYATSADRLALASRGNMLPEDGGKYDKLVQELAAGVLMTRQGLPARLSKDSMSLIPYWERELKEDPTISDKLERDVNNAVKVVMEISRGKAKDLDYGKMRGDVQTEKETRSFTIATELGRYPSIEQKHVVIVKDKSAKSADVILPNGASLEMGTDISGLNKNRILKALNKEGFEPEKIKFYNAGGAFALKESNEYFKGKEVEVSQLKQYTLIQNTRLNLDQEISRTSQVQFEKVQILKDDYGKFALYVRPEKEFGEAFTVYPEPKDIKKWFDAIASQDSEKLVNTSQEVGSKYYKLIQGREDLKASIDIMPKYDPSIALDRLTSVNITRDKKDSNRFILFATIDGQKQKPKEVSPVEVERFFLVGDKDSRETFKKQLAAKVFIAELKPEAAQVVKTEAVIDNDGGQTREPVKAEKEVHQEQTEQQEEKTSERRGFHL